MVTVSEERALARRVRVPVERVRVAKRVRTDVVRVEVDVQVRREELVVTTRRPGQRHLTPPTRKRSLTVWSSRRASEVRST